MTLTHRSDSSPVLLTSLFFMSWSMAALCALPDPGGWPHPAIEPFQKHSSCPPDSAKEFISTARKQGQTDPLCTERLSWLLPASVVTKSCWHGPHFSGEEREGQGEAGTADWDSEAGGLQAARELCASDWAGRLLQPTAWAPAHAHPTAASWSI